MKMTEIHEKAKKLGIKGTHKKIDLIRKIQIEEGNQPCYRTGNGSCNQNECCWRKDCLI